MDHLSSFKQLLSEVRHVAIITHMKPDADALGSSLGLANYLKKRNIETTVVAPSDYPYFLSWMPNSNHVVAVVDKTSEEEAYAVFEHAQIIFCLDFSSLSRIGPLGIKVRNAQAKKVLIDHHLDPERFADFIMWDPEAASAASLVYQLIKELGDQSYIDSDIANCLYAGLMTDTGGFRHANTRHEEFVVASSLVASGADPAYVSKQIYDSNTLSRVRFMGFVLSERLTLLSAYNTVHIVVRDKDLTRFGACSDDVEGLVNYGLSIQGVCLAVLIYERKKGMIKLSLRSLGSFPANELAKKHFNGGGHRNAAGGHMNGTVEEALQRLFDILPAYNAMLNS